MSKTSKQTTQHVEYDLQPFFRLSLDLLCVAGLDGYFKWVNPAFERVLGFSSAELLANPFLNFVHPDDKAKTIAEMSKLKSGVPAFEFENRYQCKDGSYRWLSWTSFPLLDQGLLYAVARDITERKETDQQLRLHLAMVEAAANGIIIADRNGAILWSNPAFTAMTGYTAEEVRGKNPRILKSGKQSIAVYEDMWTTILGGKVWRGEIINKRKDGSFYTEEMTITPIRALGDEVTHFIAIKQDVTERKQAEEAKLLRDLASRLQSAREEERTEVAREIHDELGQALTAMKLDLRWVSGRLSDEKPELRERADAMDELLDRTIQRVRRIAAELRPGVLDEFGLPEAIGWQAQEFEKRTGIICEVQLPPGELESYKDVSTTVFRIFQESLTNIARHARAKRVTARLAKQDKWLVFEVHDDGRGITESEISAGNSLGLLGMRERARLFGGTLEVSGAQGKGTTIRLRLPCKLSEEAEKSA